MIDFQIGDLVVLIAGRENVYSIKKFYPETDDVELVRYVDHEPRWMMVKVWQIRKATEDECKIGRRI